MRLTIQKHMKAVYAFLLISSAIASFFKPHLIPVCALSLLGFIAYDIVSYLRDKNPPAPEMGEEIKLLRASLDKLEKDLGDVKNDHSIAHLASTFKRK